MKDREPVYLGGEVNRVGCEPLWETELREARERLDDKPNVANHLKNLFGCKGVDGYTGFYKGGYYDKGIRRLPKGRERLKSTQDIGVNKNP